MERMVRVPVLSGSTRWTETARGAVTIRIRGGGDPSNQIWVRAFFWGYQRSAETGEATLPLRPPFFRFDDGMVHRSPEMTAL
jgi:hypothetical protein